MVTKTISLKEEAYKRLKAHKREDESFSDVVNRLTGGDRDVWKGYGMYQGETGEQLRETVTEVREEMDHEMNERNERIADELSGAEESE